MENGLDNLLVPSLRKTIEENLGKKTLNKIEQRLVERHGMNLVQAIKEFSKFDSVLREFFGPGADGLESKFLENIEYFNQHPDKTLGLANESKFTFIREVKKN